FVCRNRRSSALRFPPPLEHGAAPMEGAMSRAGAGVVVLSLSFTTTIGLAQRPTGAQFGDPLPGLTTVQLLRFDDGLHEFTKIETIEDGLGPVFNEASCAACHVGPGAAIGGSNGRLETRFGRIAADGSFDPMPFAGGSLLQDHGIGSVPGGFYAAEQIPAAATIVAGRRTTPLFGLGLVDAVPDSAFAALAAAQAARNAEIAGVVSVVTDISTGQPAVGKFGWKAQVPSLFVFAGDAYLNEMGITNPLFPSENCPQGDCSALAHNPAPGLNDDGSGIVVFTDFMRFLAPPPRDTRPNPAASHGEVIAARIGCLDCHVPSLQTGDSDVAALRLKVFHPFSDFLLHDMGALGDGITQNQATGRLMRTQPLWGLRTQTTLLHDGRATTIEDAILAHDGQGAESRRQFVALKPIDRAHLLAFLGSL